MINAATMGDGKQGVEDNDAGDMDAERGGSGMPDPLIGDRVAALEAAVAALTARLEAMERGRPE